MHLARMAGKDVWNSLEGLLGRRWALPAVVLLAVALPAASSVFRDFTALESDMILAACGTWDDIWDELGGNLRDHSPLYLWMLHGWTTRFGSSAAAIRSLSILWGLVAVGYTYLLGRTWRDHRTGVLSALLLVATPAFVVYAREARIYMVYIACMVAGGARRDRRAAGLLAGPRLRGRDPRGAGEAAEERDMVRPHERRPSEGTSLGTRPAEDDGGVARSAPAVIGRLEPTDAPGRGFS